MKEDGTSTTQRLLRSYSTLTHRRTAHDPAYRDRIFRSFERIYGPILPPDKTASILDVGCGEGSFLLYLRERGYMDLAGFDISPENVSICQREGLGFVHKFDALSLDQLPEDRRFDMISILDLLEHLPKQQTSTFVERARQRLADGGTLVIQTPNMGSVLGTFYRYDDLTHEFGLTEKTARDLLLSAGFKDARIAVSPAWNAATLLGKARESYLRLLHKIVFLADDRARPTIPTKNLLIVAQR